MADKVAQHTHCQMCGKAVPVSETLCSEDCKQKYEGLIKKRKRWYYLFYALIFLFFILLVFQITSGQ